LTTLQESGSVKDVRMATIKQKLAFKKVVNGMPITRAMKAVNYADTTAGNTNKLTASKGWKELIDKYISEKALMKVHKEGLGAYRTEKEGDNEVRIPDFATRHKYLETGYKIRGRLKADEQGDTYNQFNFVWKGEDNSNPIRT